MHSWGIITFSKEGIEIKGKCFRDGEPSIQYVPGRPRET